MNVIKQTNLLVSFLLELVLIVLFSYWGYQLGDSILTNYLFALLLPGFLIAIWGLWVAPKSKRRLKNPFRTISKLLLFSLGVLICFHTEHPVWGFIYGSIILLNVCLAKLFKQDY
ncbi:MAG TPA: YrdB family protein [Sunxiuqinia sp.]|nr:YrdB family protein [Sunxiuqinia sp.]